MAGKKRKASGKPPTPKQRAARARFAAMARARAAGGRIARGVRSVAKKGRGGFHRAKGSIVKEARPLQMLLFGALGYTLKGAIADSGLGWFLYNRIPAWHAAVDANFNAGNQEAAKDGGAGMLVKLAGVGGASYSVYKSKTGKIPTGVLNTVAPFSLGAILDPPPGPTGGAQGAYW